VRGIQKNVLKVKKTASPPAHFSDDAGGKVEGAKFGMRIIMRRI
jgi:hypothetical protein